MTEDDLFCRLDLSGLFQRYNEKNFMAKKTSAKKTSSKPSASNGIAYGCLALFGLPFALIGLAATAGVLRIGYDDLRIQFWTETPCEIVSANLVAEPGDDMMVYRVQAEYRYLWQGTAMVGKRVSLMDGSSDSNKSGHQQIVDELQKHLSNAKPFRCWVNPSRPAEAILYRDGQWGQVTLVSLAAVVFGGVGFGLLGLVFFSWRENRRPTGKTSSTEREWQTRADWADGIVVCSDRKNGRILNTVAGGMLLISAPSFLISSRAVIAGNALALLGIIPAAISLLTQRKAGKMLARSRRFGDSVLHLDTLPGVIGGEFRAVIRPERLPESPDGYQLKLTCTETSRSSGDDGSTTTNVWENEQTVVRELHDASDSLAIPVRFYLPFDAPTTELDPTRDRRTWRLRVKSLTAGHGYQAEFEVPVFRTSDSNPNYQPPADPQKFIARPDPLSAVKASGVIVEDPGEGGYRFTFPRGRHIAFTVALLVVQVVFAAAVIAGLYFYWKAGWMYVAAVLGFGIAWALADMWFCSIVDVTREGLVVQSGRFMLGASRTINASDIQEIILNAAGTWGSVAAFDIHAKLKSGSTVLLAKRVLPRPVAELCQSHLNPRNVRK